MKKYAKALIIYLIALGAFHYSMEKKFESLEKASPESTEPSSHHSQAVVVKGSRSPASVLSQPQIIKSRIREFALKGGSDYCPKNLVLTERKDCGGFEIADPEFNFKDQFCNINKGVQKLKEKGGEGVFMQHLVTTRKDGKVFKKTQSTVAYNAKKVLQKAQSEVQVILQGKDLMLDYSVNGSGSSCLYTNKAAETKKVAASKSASI